MKAFIEYPEVSDDRIEVKAEFVVETRAHRLRRVTEETIARLQHNITTLDETKDQYWKDEC